MALLLCLGTSGMLSAATLTWSGSVSTDFDDRNNWSPSNKPGQNDDLIFTGTNTTVNLAATGKATSIVFDSSAGAFTIQSGSSDILQIHGAAGITNNDTQTQTFTLGISLQTNQTWTSNAGSLAFTGPISGSNTLAIAGPAVTVFSGNNTYSGATTVNSGGQLNIRHNNALGTTGAATTIASGGAVQLQGGLTGVAENFTVNGTGVSSTGAIRNISGSNTISGTITEASASSIGSDAGTLTISGNIARSGNSLTFTGSGNTTVSGVISGGYADLAKDGTGTVTLSGANTFDGELKLNAGTLVLQNNSALGSATYNNLVASGATLQFDGSRTITESAFQINGTGAGGAGAIRATNGNTSISSDIVVQSASSIVSATGGNTLTLTGGINASGALTFDGAGDLAASNTIGMSGNLLTVAGSGARAFSGVVNGNGGFTKTGSGTLTLSGTSDNSISGTIAVNEGTVVLNKTTGKNAWQGDLVLGDGSGGTNADVVRFSASDQLADYKDITINSSGLLDLNGNSDTIANVTMSGGNITTGAGTLTLGSSATGVTTSGSATTTATLTGNLAMASYDKTFTVNNGSAATDFELNGVLSGGYAMTKAGAGTMVMSGSSANTYTGNTTVSGGTLTLQKTAGTNAIASGTVTVNSGGTLMLGANEQIADTVGLTLAGGTFNANGFSETLGTLTLTGDSTIDFGNGASTLDFINFNLNGYSLTILNWTQGSDHFVFRSVSLSPGATVTGIRFGSLADIVIAHSPGIEIVPVIPEPSTYAFFALLALTLAGIEIARRTSKNEKTAS